MPDDKTPDDEPESVEPDAEPDAEPENSDEPDDTESDDKKSPRNFILPTDPTPWLGTINMPPINVPNISVPTDLFDSLDIGRRLAEQYANILAPLMNHHHEQMAKMVERLNPILAMHEEQRRKMAALIVPPMIDMSSLFPKIDLSGFLGLEAMTREWLKPVMDSFEGIRELTKDLFPDNLSGVDFELDDLTVWMMDEGLPIAWVPNSETVALVIAAGSPGARRAVYGRRWRGILNDCADRLDRMTASDIQVHVEFARKAIRAMRADQWEAGQALTGNTLDTVMLNYFDKKTRIEIVGKNRIDPDEYGVRQYFAFAQVWGIHRQFWADKGDKIPGTFNRHGTVHGVSKRQYSRINAVLGIAHLTSILWFLNLFYTRRK